MADLLEVQMQEDEDKKLIQNAYRRLLRTMPPKMEPQDRKNIRMAYELAVEAHSKQRRKSGEPYILHPIAVAKICVEEIGLGPTAVIAALLHDVVEDTDVTLEDLREKFGDRIAKMVDGLTKLDGAYISESQQAENFRKVLSTLVDDIRVVLIKMADRLHNLRTIGSMQRHKQLKIAAETNFIYAPLAHRLGLYAIKTEFLDLCMKITDPDTYKDIAKKLEKTKRGRADYIQEFTAPLITRLDELGMVYKIVGRPKSIYSIWNKIKSKEVQFEEIYDLFAIRIIIDAPPEKEKMLCWLTYSTVTDVYRPVPERLKDWITWPKLNGYESLHTTVMGNEGRFVEVQIRTERMDEIAERGYAAHWKYKGIKEQRDTYEHWLDSVREMLEDPNSDAVEFLGDFKANTLFSHEIYVYTPNGDMKVLPVGATALDFAFSIHSDLGYHCSSVRVNGRIVPMGHKLESSDRVEVITSKNQKPSEDWLKMVITGKARSKIRYAMKEERRKQGEIGKESLMRKLKNMKVDYEPAVELLVKHFEFSSHIDLYFEIAMGRLTIPNIFKHFKAEGTRLVEVEKTAPAEGNKDTDDGKSPRIAKPGRYSEKPRLMVNGELADEYEFSFATCCNPLPGDNIFAYVTQNAGLKIHRISCPNATNMMVNYGYRVMKAEWVSIGSTHFVANLKITGIDNGPGVIEVLTKKISSELKLNIRAFSIKGDQGYFEGEVSLLVSNTDQLTLAMQALKSLENVSSVTRMA